MFFVVLRRNGSEILFENVTSADEMTIPRAVVGENVSLWLTVTAYNRLGASQSARLDLSLQDIGSYASPRSPVPKALTNL